MNWNLIIGNILGAVALAAWALVTSSCATNASGADSHSHVASRVEHSDDARVGLGQETLKSQQATKSLAAPSEVEPGQVTGVEMEQLFNLVHANRVLIVDCRPPIYYHLGHIDGAMNLPLRKYDKVIESRKGSIEKALADNKVVVLYCQNVNCPDAYAAAKKLTALGYSVSIYKGGWEEWKQAGL